MSDYLIDRQQENWDNRLDELDYEHMEQTQLQQHDNEEFWKRVNESADKLNF